MSAVLSGRIQQGTPSTTVCLPRPFSDFLSVLRVGHCRQAVDYIVAVGPSTSPRGHLSCHRLRVLESRCAVALAKDWLLFAVRSMLPAAWLWPSWLDAASDRPDVGPLGGVTVDVVVCCIVTLQTWSDLRVWRRPFDCLAYMRTIDSISAHP